MISITSKDNLEQGIFSQFFSTDTYYHRTGPETADTLERERKFLKQGKMGKHER